MTQQQQLVQYQIQQTLSQYPALVQDIMTQQQQLVQYQIQQTLSQYPELVQVIMTLLYSATVSAVPDSADPQSISRTCTGNYDTAVLSNS